MRLNQEKTVSKDNGTTINILGTDFRLIICEDLPEYALGQANLYDHWIKVRPRESYEEEQMSEGGVLRQYQETLRHELLHSFASEAGMSCYANDEILIEWMAKMFPKFVELFQEVGAL